ncbi:Pol polyprotein, partial [Mucuna pruriens]
MAHHQQIEEGKADYKPWYHDIREYLNKRIYPLGEIENDKRTLRRLAAGFFLSGAILYKRSTDLTLLRVEMTRKPRRSWRRCTKEPLAPMLMDLDMIGPIEPKASNGHRFILVAIDYFTKWVEAASYTSMTKSVVVKFIKRNIICQYDLPAHIITDNRTNLNNKMMSELCGQFKIKHHNSTPYRPNMNGVVEVANKNIKRILNDVEWIQSRLDKLNLIQDKWLIAICHGQLYQRWVKSAFDRKVRPCIFKEGDLVLKKRLPNIKYQRGKWAPNYESPYTVKRAFTGGALVLANSKGQELKHLINSDAVKLFYP